MEFGITDQPPANKLCEHIFPAQAFEAVSANALPGPWSGFSRPRDEQAEGQLMPLLGFQANPTHLATHYGVW